MSALWTGNLGELKDKPTPEAGTTCANDCVQTLQQIRPSTFVVLCHLPTTLREKHSTHIGFLLEVTDKCYFPVRAPQCPERDKGQVRKKDTNLLPKSQNTGTK